MKKVEIVKKIIGSDLEQYGFHYFKTEPQEWVFERKACGYVRYYRPGETTVMQYISIQKSRFDNIITVKCSTDVYGKEGAYNLLSDNISTKYCQVERGWIRYRDDSSFINAIEIVAQIIKEYGIKLLEELSKEEPDIPTQEMAHNLFQNYKELDKHFIKEHHINPLPKTEQDIEEWFLLIKKIFGQIKGKSYRDVQEILVQIAAFLGERNCSLFNQKWEFYEHLKTPKTCGTMGYPSFVPLDQVVNIWKTNNNVLLYEYENAYKKRICKESKTEKGYNPGESNDFGR